MSVQYSPEQIGGVVIDHPQWLIWPVGLDKDGVKDAAAAKLSAEPAEADLVQLANEAAATAVIEELFYDLRERD